MTKTSWNIFFSFLFLRISLTLVKIGDVELAAGFLAAGFLAAFFLAGDLLAAGFFAGDVLAAGLRAAKYLYRLFLDDFKNSTLSFYSRKIVV